MGGIPTRRALVVEVGWRHANLQTQVFHVHIARHLEVLNALLEVLQMVDERPVEVLSFMHVFFEVCLTHEREVQLGEESLATRVDLGRLLQELK